MGTRCAMIWVWVAIATAVAAPRIALASQIPEGVGLSVNIAMVQDILIKPKPTGSADTTGFIVGMGYQIIEVLRFEIALVLALRARQGGAFDVQLRSSFVLDAPQWPMYVRLTAGFVQLLTGPAGPVFGTSVGADYRFRGEPFLVFVEGGFLSHQDTMRSGKVKLHWLIEARVGGVYTF